MASELVVLGYAFPMSAAANDWFVRLAWDSRSGSNSAPPSDELRYRNMGNAAKICSTGFTRL